MGRSRRLAIGRITVVSLIVAASGCAALAVAEAAPGRAAKTQTRVAAAVRSTTPSVPSTSAAPSTAPPVPVATAPSSVGVLHLALSRPGSDGSQRRFAVTVRYPAPATGGADVSDTPAAAGSFPLVVFAHGYDTSADTYAGIEHDLASAGFIVAAPDFPHTSNASTDGLDESDVTQQPADLSFVIDTLTSSAPTPIAGHVAGGKVGAVGHSDGGVTTAGLAYNTCCADRRIGVAVVLSGAEAQFAGSWFPAGSPPLLAVHGTADEVNSFSSSQRLFDDAPGSKYLVSVADGSHLEPFTTDPVRPAVSALVADFLHANLSGDPAAARRIATDANVSGLHLVASG